MKISFIFILFLFCSLHSYGTTPKIKVYCNPVLAKSTPDPTVIQAPDGMFYLYATEDIHNIPIYKSPDLVNWTFVGTAFTDATRPTFEPKAGLWAPDINHIDGKYVLYYAMSRWNGYFWTMILLKDLNKIPLQVYLKQKIIDQNMSLEMASTMAGQAYSITTTIYALVICSMIPVLIAFPFIQKYFTKGVMVGAVKG